MPARDRIPKSYVSLKPGQVHLRSLGDGPDALLLIHWTPLSGRMWAHVAPLFAAAGLRVLMPDLLGYGRSDPRPEAWSMEAYADLMAELLDALGIGRAHVLGGHNGASIVAELALRHPTRVDRLVLDGCPILTDELRAAFRGLTSMSRPLPQADGSHKALAWERTEGLLREYIPGFTVTPETIDMVWPALIDYLETDFVSSGPVAGAYDLAARLPLVRQPTLLMTAEKDTLVSTFETACALLPTAQTHRFAGQHPIHFAEEAARFVKPVLSFLTAGQPT
jgi:pimeloyl-ACP methyl ester carboxylesterase